MAFEEQLAQKMFKEDKEKTYVDKILAKDSIQKIKIILNKEEWVREDIIDLSYLLNTEELKLSNIDDWERDIILKHFLMIEECCRLLECIYEYYENTKKRESTCKTCNLMIKNKITSKKLDSSQSYCACAEPKTEKIFDALAEEQIHKIIHTIRTAIKSTINTHCGIIRSGMSLSALGLKKITDSRYEIAYDQSTVDKTSQSKKGIFGF